MAELSADILLRTQQVDAKLRQTGAKFAQLGKDATKGAAVASAALDDIPQQLDRVNKATRRSSIIWFQAGQAISDFAVAGVLSAANNIEFLAAQVGLGGPLMLGIAAATTAFVLFGDEIKEALTGASAELEQLQKDVKGVADELVKVKDGLSITFEGTTEELEADSERIGQIIAALEQKALDLNSLLGREQNKNIGGVATFLATSPEIERLKSDLERVNTVLARQKGIQESINETVSEQRLLEQVIADLGDTGLQRKVKEAKTEREKLTLLQQAEQQNAKLLEQLTALRNADQSRLGALMLQNDALRDQIKIVERLAKERARIGTGSLGVAGLSGVAGLGIQDQTFDLPGTDEARGVGISKKDLDALEEASDKYLETAMRMRDANEQLASSIADGIGGAFASLASSLGSGESLFNSLRKSIGTFAVQVGQTLIGFGTAGMALKAFITNPVGAIIAGGGLVALGSALKSSVSDQATSFSATGSAGASLGPNIIDPREGRRFQRGYEPEAPYSMTLLDKLASINWSYTLQGEDLVAAVDTTTRRQSRTRETSYGNIRNAGR